MLPQQRSRENKMADDQAKPSGPDLTQGVALAELADGGMLAGPCRRRTGAAGARAARRCSRWRLSAPTITGRSPKGWWSATRCAARGTTPASACAPARRCVPPALSPIACWSVEQRDGKIFVTGKRSDVKPAPRGKPRGDAAGPDRDRRRRRGGLRGGRDAAAPGLRGQHRHAERRRCGARRPAQPVQGLPRRQRARGMDSAARRRLLRRQRHRAPSQGERRRHRPAQPRGGRSPMAARLPTTACCWRPAPSRCGCRLPAPTSRTSTRCAPSPTAAPSSSAPRRRAAPS